MYSSDTAGTGVYSSDTAGTGVYSSDTAGTGGCTAVILQVQGGVQQ